MAYVPYRVGEDGDWDKTTGIITENNRTSYQVSGLDPFTVYSFQVVGVNALGESPPSKESYYIVTLREGYYPFFSFTWSSNVYKYTYIYSILMELYNIH